MASPVPVRSQTPQQMVTVPVAAAVGEGLTFLAMATATASSSTKPKPPQTKREAQAVLRHFGYAGLKIDAIEPGTVPQEIARVYALTGPVLEADGEMRRRARTYVLVYEGDEIRARELAGWRVVDPEDEELDRQRLALARAG